MNIIKTTIKEAEITIKKTRNFIRNPTTSTFSKIDKNCLLLLIFSHTHILYLLSLATFMSKDERIFINKVTSVIA